MLLCGKNYNMENMITNEKNSEAEGTAGQTASPNHDKQEQTKQSRPAESDAHNTGDEHMQVDEEGVEISPDDQA